MPSSEAGKPAQWRLLDFFCDDGGSCALTVLLDGHRLHVIADATKLGPDSKAGKELRCLTADLDGASRQPRTNDQARPDAQDAEGALHDWMMSPLLATVLDAAPLEDGLAAPTCTLQEWYHRRTRFFELQLSKAGNKTEAIELESTAELEARIDKLLPQATLPKYITKQLTVPCYSARDFTVLGATNQPPGTPYHPDRVQHCKTKQTYFLKVVDNLQPQAAKREIHALHRIRQLALDKQFQVPSLKGLVTFHHSRKTTGGKMRIMGFAMTEIPNPTPLTMMLRSDVAQGRREAWATNVQMIKNLLHENDIVWGDAKADNFVVDGNDDLWIIDFGGEYTEGWMDPQLNETVAGDNMGTEKIVNALTDPVANIYSSEDEFGREKDNCPPDRKRKRSRVSGKSSDDGNADPAHRNRAKSKRTR